MARYQVTLDIALLWSADTGRARVLLTLGISIVLIIHSLDGFDMRQLLSE